MLLACSNMTLPDSSSSSGACHPPCAKPLSRSSSGPPGACATPSSVTNSVTTSLPMVSSSPGGDDTSSDLVLEKAQERICLLCGVEVEVDHDVARVVDRPLDALGTDARLAPRAGEAI